ncbi:MAG: response regulator transcription factor [Clostridium sp.]|uniref:response regulator transcription factor n=1 Tax=Clostridium sp. TaxID=1506 RepID=UPI00290B1926|nr:response regulator transcription factor [Clostridium sp.]MDU7337723.1 response regulator transcription factor [Clostridium sp.]
MRTKILIVDDEIDIVAMLKGFFESKNYDVLTATDGVEAIKQSERQPDIILLDINMPNLDGLSVCERVRDYVSCPILFLTARIEDADKVKGFAAGGDDYILKPFSIIELEARVAAHLRREKRRVVEAKVKFDEGFTIDYLERCVYWNNEVIPFVKKEFDIIELLSQNAGQVFDKERIYERVWGYDGEGGSSVIFEHIRRIRSKLAAANCRPYIETVWGCGYKWKK